MLDPLEGDPNQVAKALFRGLPERYDLLSRILSLGQDPRWRRQMVDAALSGSPSRELDVATGTAAVALAVAARSDAWVTGVDLSAAMLAEGRRRVRAAGFERRVRLTRARGEELPFGDGCFDAVTFTYLLRYVEDPDSTISELARVLRPGGVLASLEFHVPPRTFWRIWWYAYTRLVLPLAGWLVGGRPWFRVGRFLGPSISGHYRLHPVRSTLDAWHKAGITGVQVRLMSLGGGVVMWGTKQQ